jgi:Ca2+-binding EF-hand superfamily protein
MENEKPMVDRLITLNKKLLTDMESKDKKENGYNRKEFYKLMVTNGISSDTEIINKLFWIFDENGDNRIKIKELALGLELFTESPLEKKLKVFFDLCDEDNSGLISKNELLTILRNNLINHEEKAGVKNIIDRIFALYKLDDKGELSL